MKLTKKQAIELSIKKWEYIVNNNGSEDGLINKYPKLNNIQNNCGLCEYYMLPVEADYNNQIEICDKCPLIIKIHNDDNLGCLQTNHPFRRWLKGKTNKKKNAQAVLDLIKSIKI